MKENYIIAKNALKIAQGHNTTVAAISIAYLVNQKIDVVPIMFFDNAEQIKEVFCGARLKLSEEEMKILTI